MTVKIVNHGDWLKLLGDCQDASLDVLTYSFEGDLGKIHAFLVAREGSVRIVAHERFRREAQLLQAENPRTMIRLVSATHTKLVVVRSEKWTRAILGSANFGSTTWDETLASLSDEASVAALSAVFEKSWARGRDVEDFTKGASLSVVKALAETVAKDVMKNQAVRAFNMKKKAST